jgi:hypothetical protein
VADDPGATLSEAADRYAVLAAECRAQERQARSKGDLGKAEQSRLKAEGLEQQGWTYRKASFQHWKWPELKP